MDEIFIKMFGEEYAKSFYHLVALGVKAYMHEDDDEETKKECISELLLNLIEYYKNKDTVWYE